MTRTLPTSLTAAQIEAVLETLACVRRGGDARQIAKSPQTLEAERELRRALRTDESRSKLRLLKGDT